MKAKSLIAISLLLIIVACNDNDNGDNGGNSPNIVVITEDIQEFQTWYSDTIYIIAGDIDVYAGLTIQPGTVIKFNSNESINILDNGQLNAKGTQEKPIVFTSIKDDLFGSDNNNDENATNPDKGDWGNVNLGNSNGSKLEYCIIQYGGNNSVYGALNLGEKTSTVSYCTFANNNGYVSGNEFYGAIYADEASAATVIKNNLFYNNIVPLSLNSEISLDNSNIFSKIIDSDTLKNKYNGIFVHSQDIMNNSVVWEENEVPFVISWGSLQIWESVSLTLGDNVALKFQNGAGLEINTNGLLINYNEPGVVFTSFKDDLRKGDTNGDGNTTEPSISGEWDGIINLDNLNYYSWSNIYYNEN